MTGVRFALPVLALLAACGAEPDGQASGQQAAASRQGEIAADSDAEPTPPSGPDPEVAALAAPPSAGGVGCSVQETPIFACKLTNGKRVAVCGSGEWLGHYRYGSAKPELALDGGRYAYAMYSGGGESQIEFTNDGHRYIVFSRMVRTNFTPGEPNNPAMSDGVMVFRGDNLIAMQTCSGGDMLPVQLSSANAIWEDEGELFTDETMRADP